MSAQETVAVALDRMVALFRAVEARVRELNPSAPRMEVLSLYEALKAAAGAGGERWRSITFARTTLLDEETREMIWRLAAMYEEVAAVCLGEAESETFTLSLRNTYLRGKASANFVILNVSGIQATVPPEVLLAELGVVVACAQQLFFASRAAAPPGGLP